MTQDLLTVLSQFPATLAKQVENIIIDPSFSAYFTSQQVEQLTHSTDMDTQTLAQHLLPLAAAYAYTPISDFRVGAIVLGESGALYFGANIEFSNVQLGQTIHAEQAAIVHAWMAGEKRLTDIIIDTPPCGHCRQFMNELSGADTLHITLPGKEAKKLHDYLPEAFGPLDLGIQTGLMGEQSHQVHAEYSDPLKQEAIKALNKSYAPYSNTFSGIAIELTDQRVSLGAYAENAAFNPSLPPLQVALVQLRMHGSAFNDIKRVVLAETKSGKITHLDDTRSTLQKIDPNIQLEYIQI
ncbi:cytidine deaminase [Vibrio mangrovi]|uniref:Cytidine deaminase n=1 Tax=Vibrio mangrovi TaxID=474394 RepID=A0A1Y6IMU4_9VIBR|nr:cytidine deaminase [Vibrio mangrovi]MDW6004245.1 cytidine deaminase [Vibrio mangrovi]SMR98956.1 Cytidine deaminase [Vibrio mangrovi]